MASPRDRSLEARVTIESAKAAVEYAAARALADATTIAEATPRILEAICDALGWAHGALWQRRLGGRRAPLRRDVAPGRRCASTPSTRSAATITFAPGSACRAACGRAAGRPGYPTSSTTRTFRAPPSPSQDGTARRARLSHPARRARARRPRVLQPGDPGARRAAARDAHERRQPDRAGPRAPAAPRSSSIDSSTSRSICSALPDSTAISSASTRRGRPCSAIAPRSCWHALPRSRAPRRSRRDDRRSRRRSRRAARVISFENRFRCRDGSYRWLQWTSRPFAGEQAIYAAARDITERKAGEQQLQQYAGELETAKRSLEENAAQPVAAREGARGRRKQRAEEAHARQGRVPRQHEPRDPHADERDRRHDAAGARHGAHRRAARVPQHGPDVGRVAASRSSTTSSTSRRSRRASSSSSGSSFGVRDTLEDAMRALALRAQEKGLELACRIQPGRARRVLVGDPGRAAAGRS